MPTRPKKPCAYPGCPELVPAGQTYCEMHREIYNKNRHQRYDVYERNERAKKFYSSPAWKKLRKIQLNEQPLCAMCLKKNIIKQAEMVDHIVPIQINWSLRLVKSNLQSLCNRCHAIKTAEDKKKYNLQG